MVKEYINDIKNEFQGYNAKKFNKDILAGLTVTAVALPLALAFGVSCGASAAAGLITAVLAGLIIGALSGASFQISGPTGAMTVILVVVFQKFGLEGIWITGVLSGVILIIVGLLKFGRVVSFIPSPVLLGFTSGIAVVIAIGQIDNFLGTKSQSADTAFLKLINYFINGIQINKSAVLIGAVVILFMLLWPKKLNAFLPSSLAALILSFILCKLFPLSQPTIGSIPQAVLLDQRLSLFSIDFTKVSQMIVPAFSIAALGMIESLLCGAVGGKMKGEKFNSNRELVAQGIGNLIIPFFGGVPATAAIARSSVAIKAGGITRLVSIVHSVGILASMFLLAPFMSSIPLSALAGVLIVTAWRMNEWDKIRYIFSKRLKGGIFKYLITLSATVALDLTQAIVIGVVFSILLFVFKISDIEVEIQDIDPKRLPETYEADPSKKIRVCYITGPIFFPTVEKMSASLAALDKTDALILSMRGVPLVDVSGVEALMDLNKHLKQSSCKIMLCGIQPKVEAILQRSGFIDEIGEEMIFWSADQAIMQVYHTKTENYLMK